MRRSNRVVPALLALLLGAGTAACSATEGSAEPPSRTADSPTGDSAPEQEPRDTDLIRVALAERGQAAVDGDLEAFLSSVAPPLRASQEVMFSNLQALGVTVMYYEVDLNSVRQSRPSGVPTIRMEAREFVQLHGSDTDVVAYPVALTFARGDEAWTLAADKAPSARATKEPRAPRLWAGGKLGVRHDGPLTTVVDDEDQELLDDLAALTDEALTDISAELGIPAERRLLVDATTVGGPTLLGAPGAGDALASSYAGSRETSLGQRFGAGGWRLKFNPEAVRDQPAQTLNDRATVRHEVLHTLLRDRPVPTWLNEGLAELVQNDYVSTGSLTVPSTVFNEARSVISPTHLITDKEFSSHPVSGYVFARATIDELVQRRGLAGVMALVEAYRKSKLSYERLDRYTATALRRVYGASEAEIARAAYQRMLTLNVA